MFRNNPQFVVLLIFFALSGLSWVMNKLREQKQIKDINEARRKRREEELRTGRESAPETGRPNTSQGEPLPSLQELAAKRQQQLEELRARQQAKARQGGTTPPVVRQVPTPTQTRPTIRPVPPMSAPTPVRRPVPPARTPTPPTNIPSARGKGAVPKRRPIVIGKPPAPKPPVRPSAPAVGREEPSRTRRGLASTTGVSDEFGEATTKGLLTDVHADAHAPEKAPFSRSAAGMYSRDSMRRAVIMSEILSPPVALREGF